MTYSIVARDPATGELGVAVQTHQPAVGSIVPWVKAGVGAVATQSFANINFGPQALALLESGLPAHRALAAILAADDMPARRQVAILAAARDPAVHTGDQCIPHAGHRTGEHYSVQANMMLNDTVPNAMMDAFERAAGGLAERMLVALEAAQAQGGDIRGSQSAAILVRAPGPLNSRWDLRVDNSPQPLAELRRLVELRLLGATLRLEGDEQAASADLQSQLEAAKRFNPPDEELFWFAIQGFAGRAHDIDAAVAVLEPIFARAPQWRELLHRLDLPEAGPLKERLPR